MSQKAVFVKIKGELADEVFKSIPNDEEIAEIIAEMIEQGELESKVIYEQSYKVVVEEWEIGEGSHLFDTFFDDEALLDLRAESETPDDFIAALKAEDIEAELVFESTYTAPRDRIEG